MATRSAISSSTGTDRAPIERVWSPATGLVHVPYTHWRTGDHHRRGLMMVKAPGVVPGAAAGPLDAVHVAPTLAASLGVELPDVDGVAGMGSRARRPPPGRKPVDRGQAAPGPRPGSPRRRRARVAGPNATRCRSSTTCGPRAPSGLQHAHAPLHAAWTSMPSSPRA